MIPTLNGATAGGGMPLPEFAALAAKAGFRGIEVNAGEIARMIKETSLDDVKAVFGSNGVVPAAFGFPIDFRGDDEKWKASLQAAPAAIEAAVAVGCRRCVTWIMPRSELSFDENWDFHVKRLKPGVALLKEQGVAFGVEFVAPKTMRTGPNDFIWNLEQALWLARDTGGDGVLLDSFHWFCAGLGVRDLEKLRSEQIVHVHINDAPDRPRDEQIDNQRLLPGDGNIDLKSFLGALNKIGYNGGVSVEVFNEDLRKLTPEEGAARAYKAVSSVMREAGVA